MCCAEADEAEDPPPGGFGGPGPGPRLAGPRLIVAVVGGASYAELREVYQLSRLSGRQISLVTTSFLTPEEHLARFGKAVAKF